MAFMPPGGLKRVLVALEQLRGEVDGLGLDKMEDRIITFFKAEQLKEVWLSRNEYLKRRNQNK